MSTLARTALDRDSSENYRAMGRRFRQTLARRRHAIERVIAVMRQDYAEPLQLRDMARMANSSPCHFSRVFREMTGLPPRHFLATVRVSEAKRLLTTTRRSVTRICCEVGYASLGSFTAHFTRLVGVSPSVFRQACSDRAGFPGTSAVLADYPGEPFPTDLGNVTGTIAAPWGFCGLIVLALFPSATASPRPVACTLVRGGATTYRISNARDGKYYILAAGVPEGGDAYDAELCLRGRTGPVLITGGVPSGSTSLVLRSSQITDPPLLVALPLLLRNKLEAARPLPPNAHRRSSVGPNEIRRDPIPQM